MPPDPTFSTSTPLRLRSPLLCRPLPQPAGAPLPLPPAPPPPPPAPPPADVAAAAAACGALPSLTAAGLKPSADRSACDSWGDAISVWVVENVHTQGRKLVRTEGDVVGFTTQAPRHDLQQDPLPRQLSVCVCASHSPTHPPPPELVVILRDNWARFNRPGARSPPPLRARVRCRSNTSAGLPLAPAPGNCSTQAGPSRVVLLCQLL